MAWLEITLKTAADTVEDMAAALTAGGFPELVIEDQNQIEDCREQNRAKLLQRENRRKVYRRILCIIYRRIRLSFRVFFQIAN